VVSQTEIENLTDNGADGFVKKPFDIDQLVQRMEDLLQM
jgi:DNA-binding response OmpR family regulator